MPLVQIHEDLLDGRLVPILPGWFRPPVECFIAAGRARGTCGVRVFFEWYARAMQEVFASYEAKVSAIVGLPTTRLRWTATKSSELDLHPAQIYFVVGPVLHTVVSV